MTTTRYVRALFAALRSDIAWLAQAQPKRHQANPGRWWKW